MKLTARISVSVALLVLLGASTGCDKLKSRDQINKGVVPDLFGEAFVWWCQRCFKSRLQPTGWESWQRIDELMKWLIENVKSEDLKSWEERAEKYSPGMGAAG